MANHNQHHTSRLEERKDALSRCFAVPLMLKSWKRYVKDGLRNQDILDLHDYYDFHRNRQSILSRVWKEITTGRYRPKIPVTVRVEKKLGLTRRLSIPTAEDAVVLQTIVEAILPQVKAAQPTPNAFFSRSHGFKPPEISVQDDADYFWFKKWIQFSRRRFDFASIFRVLCITDVANYFDNIDFRHLRNLISSIHAFDEVILDVLFLILEELSWRPDYLPPTGKGLPQVHFDAPRLLAHLFLFEADRLLESRTDGKFLRWVDDISITSNSVEEAKGIIRDLDEILMTRGLRLNSGKTVILNASEARKFLWQDENNYLTIFHNRVVRKLEAGDDLSDDRRRLRRRFRNFLESEKIGYWDKIYKRYFTEFGAIGDAHLVRNAPIVLDELPQVRASALRYYATLGPSRQRFEHISTFLKGDHIVDDISVFQAAKVLVDWNIGERSVFRREIVDLSWEITDRFFRNKSEVFYIAALWMLSKYGSKSDMERVVFRNENIWKVSNYLSRQVAAATARIWQSEDLIERVLAVFHQHAQTDAVNVILNLREIGSSDVLTQQTTGYMLHGNKMMTVYPLQKYLILMVLLQSPNLSNSVREQFCQKLFQRIPDRIYRAGIRRYLP